MISMTETTAETPEDLAALEAYSGSMASIMDNTLWQEGMLKYVQKYLVNGESAADFIDALTPEAAGKMMLDYTMGFLHQQSLEQVTRNFVFMHAISSDLGDDPGKYVTMLVAANLLIYILGTYPDAVADALRESVFATIRASHESMKEALERVNDVDA